MLFLHYFIYAIIFILIGNPLTKMIINGGNIMNMFLLTFMLIVIIGLAIIDYIIDKNEKLAREEARKNRKLTEQERNELARKYAQIIINNLSDKNKV